MMVAMALTMFIMVILSQAFATGVDVFGQLKAIGDMEENLRAASTSLRTDLAADHFEAKRRLSDPDFYINPPRQGFVRIYAAAAPSFEGSDGQLTDPVTKVQYFTNASFSSSTCVLHMMVKRRGNRRQDFFSASVPSLTYPLGSPLLDVSNKTNFFGQPADARLQDNVNTYTSQWAEVAYFLVQTGTTVTPGVVGTGGTPLYALYRVERVVVPDNSFLNWANANGLANTPVTFVPSPVPAGLPAGTQPSAVAYAQMSWNVVGTAPNQTMYFNNPHDLVKPANRSIFFGTAGSLAVPAGFTLDTSTTTGQANALTEGGRGAALVIGNVVSFHVRGLLSTAPTVNQSQRIYYTPPAIVFGNPPTTLNNPGPDFADILFDSGATPPLTTLTVPPVALTVNGQANGSPWSISAIAITIRIWDQKTQQARQITVTQDM
jgi:hypothetical protein